ncbi:MAG: hypothetical protein MUF81_11315 [Verrucomicrobia bacterium]|jgi:hypothetical protein|nr:hypothetical protein [Verrucomicrobiota bacterium]
MKRLILALTIVAFAVAVQAGEGKGCCKNKAACADKDKAACAAKAESGCCAKAASSAKGNCPKSQAAKKALMSPKAAGEAVSK